VQKDVRRRLLGPVFVFGVAAYLLGVENTAFGERRPEQKLVANDLNGKALFGFSVGRDIEYGIVGAPFGDDGQDCHGGSAYIYEWNGGRWVLTDKLCASDGQGGEQFGVAVAVHGDWAVVGAKFGDGATGDSGAAYVYKRSGERWVEYQKLWGSDGQLGDRFGESVWMELERIFCGAPGAVGPEVNDVGAGAVYVFEWAAERWGEQEKLQASDAGASGGFGRSICSDGERVVVGAPFAGADAGAAYVFEHDPNGWKETAKLTSLLPNVGDFFGYSVSINGDFVAIGAPGDDERGPVAGAVYMFERQQGQWVEQAKLTACNGSAGDQFGMSVSLDDGWLVVGALLGGAADGPRGAGRAYLFKFNGQQWVERGKLGAFELEQGDYFGTSVAIRAGSIFVGACGRDEGAADVGAVYVFGVCPSADFTGDCWVNFADFAVLASQWKQSGCRGVAWCGGAGLDVLTEQWLDGGQ